MTFIHRTLLAASLALAPLVVCRPVLAQSPPQTKIGQTGAVAEFRDRMIYEAIAWRALLEQAKSREIAIQLRNAGRQQGLYAWSEWNTPDTIETERERLEGCRTAVLGVRYALNDYAEGNMENYRLSLSTYSREWSKCELAFPAAVKALRKAAR